MRNDDSPIVDYKVENKKKLKKIIVFFILIFILFFTAFYIMNIMKYKEAEKIAAKALLAEISKKNSQIVIETNFNDAFLTSDRTVDFNYAKIPMPNCLIGKEKIVFFKKDIETNLIAYESPVVKIKYNTVDDNVVYTLELFRENILEKYNYERFMQIVDEEIKVYIREEQDGYFSYIIFGKYDVTFGVSYGKPEVRENK